MQHASPLPILTDTDVDRFWCRVEKGRHCWEWIGARWSKGYGKMFVRGGRRCAAHRISFQIHNGRFDHKMDVLHTCDNPSCVNPAHLYLGTNADNVRDKMARGRAVAKPPTGADSPKAKLSEAQVRELRREYTETRKLAPLAKKFGIDKVTVWRIGTGKNYKGV